MRFYFGVSGLKKDTEPDANDGVFGPVLRSKILLTNTLRRHLYFMKKMQEIEALGFTNCGIVCL
jgi:hypothetical protein